MKIIVTGGRDYMNKELVYKILDMLSPTIIISGDATGADKLSKEWAEDKEIEHLMFKANWQGLGNFAGLKRNIDMMDKFKYDMSVVVVAFPGGRGTESAIREASKRNLTVLRVIE